MYDPDRRFIYPYSDWGFKELFGTEKNKHLLLRVLNEAMPGRDIRDVTFIPPDIKLPIARQGQISIDVYCQCADSSTFLLEMQNEITSGFLDRSLVYCSAAILRDFSAKKGHYRVQETVFIAMTGENVFGGSDSAPVRLALCDLGEEKTTVLNDKLLQIFIEFPKLAERAKGKSPEEREFFEKFVLAMTRMPDCEEIPDDFGDDFFDQLFDQLFEASDTRGYPKNKIEKYRNYMINEFKYKATLAEATYDARMAGIAEGKAEGKAENSLEVAKNLKAAGVDIQIISRCTGLTPEQIDAL